MNMYICICISYDTYICIPLVLFLWRTLTYIISKEAIFIPMAGRANGARSVNRDQEPGPHS